MTLLDNVRQKLRPSLEDRHYPALLGRTGVQVALWAAAAFFFLLGTALAEDHKAWDDNAECDIARMGACLSETSKIFQEIRTFAEILSDPAKRRMVCYLADIHQIGLGPLAKAIGLSRKQAFNAMVWLLQQGVITVPDLPGERYILEVTDVEKVREWAKGCEQEGGECGNV